MKKPSFFSAAFLSGLALGVAGTVLLLAFLPPSGLPPAEPAATKPSDGNSVESFYIDLPQHGIAVTHSGRLPLGLFPPGVPRLDDERLRGGVGILTKVRNERGEVVGFAAELEVQPAGNMLEQELEWSTDWTVVIPGRGTLYLHELERSRGLGRKVVGPTLASGKPWEGDWTVQTTSGPGPDGRGLIVGGTHEFEGARGSFVEVARLTGFLPEGALVGTIELRLDRE